MSSIPTLSFAIYTRYVHVQNETMWCSVLLDHYFQVCIGKLLRYVMIVAPVINNF